MRAVKSTKRQFQFQRRLKLESQLGCPKTFWQSIKWLNISRTKKKCNLLEVRNEDGNVYSNEEAVNCWRDHFCTLLGGTAGGGEGRGSPTGETGPKEQKKNFSEKRCLPLSLEEILWTLNKVKKDATPSQDGIGVGMMLAEPLFKVWMTLFQVFWESGWLGCTSSKEVPNGYLGNHQFPRYCPHFYSEQGHVYSFEQLVVVCCRRQRVNC